MPIVRLYVVWSAHTAVLEAKLTIAVEEVVASVLHIDGREGNLTPFDIIVIPQSVDTMPFDVVIDIEAMPFPAREVGKHIMTQVILDSINALFEGSHLQIGVGLKLVLHAWASNTPEPDEPYSESINLEAALDRARRRIKAFEEDIFDDTELDT